MELDIKALVRETYEIMEAGRAYDGDTREGAKQETLSSCGEWLGMDDAGNYGEGGATDTDV